MKNSDESLINIHARKFVQRFLPPGVSDAHYFLYDWDQNYTFAPTGAELEECLKDYTELVEYASREHILNVLDLDLMLASELVLSYLHRAETDKLQFVSAAVKRRLISVTGRVVSDVETFGGGMFRHYDAIKRIASINEFLVEGSKP